MTSIVCRGPLQQGQGTAALALVQPVLAPVPAAWAGLGGGGAPGGGAVTTGHGALEGALHHLGLGVSVGEVEGALETTLQPEDVSPE